MASKGGNLATFPRMTTAGLVIAGGGGRRKGKAASEKEVLQRTIRPRVVDVTEGAELKYVDLFNNSSASSVGVMTLLTGGISQSTGQSGRVGDAVNLKSLEFNAYIEPGASTTNCMRFVIFRWNNDTSITTPAVATILQVTTATYAPCSAYNFQSLSGGTFTVIDDVMLSFADAGETQCYRCVKDLQNMEIQFGPAVTTGRGHIYVLMISGRATTAPTLDWYSRILYSDS